MEGVFFALGRFYRMEEKVLHLFCFPPAARVARGGTPLVPKSTRGGTRSPLLERDRKLPSGVPRGGRETFYFFFEFVGNRQREKKNSFFSFFPFLVQAPRLLL